MSELIPLSFQKIMQSRAYTVVILGTESKKFAIYTEPQVGHHLQMYLAQGHSRRPYTHDLLDSILKGLNATPFQVVIHGVEDTIYYARLFIEQVEGEKKCILEIDARPSDCITLAIMHKIPIFCRKEVFDRVVAVQD